MATPTPTPAPTAIAIGELNSTRPPSSTVTFGEATTPTNACRPIVAPPAAMMAWVPPFSIEAPPLARTGPHPPFWIVRFPFVSTGPQPPFPIETSPSVITTPAAERVSSTSCAFTTPTILPSTAASAPSLEAPRDRSSISTSRGRLAVEPVEAEEVVLDRQHGDAVEARFPGVSLERRAAHDGPRRRGRVVVHRRRQTAEHAVGVEEALRLAGGRAERVLGSLVGDDQRAPRLEHVPDGAEHRDGL